MVRCAVTAVGRLCQKPPGMLTVPGWNFPVTRVWMRGVKWGQRTGRWLVKAWWKLSLNSF